MKRIKSFTALICILTILLSISACDLKSQITTPEETTTIPTTTTITETTEATTTTETTETETVATTTTETSEETSETTAATKATTKPTSKKTTTKPTSKKTATKSTSKKVNTTKKVVKKSPTKPSKGYAIVKWKYIITSNDHDKDGNNIKRTFYGEFKCYTDEYGTKRASKYHMCNTSEGKAFVKKCDPNWRNYTKTQVKVVKFLN